MCSWENGPCICWFTSKWPGTYSHIQVSHEAAGAPALEPSSATSRCSSRELRGLEAALRYGMSPLRTAFPAVPSTDPFQHIPFFLCAKCETEGRQGISPSQGIMEGLGPPTHKGLLVCRRAADLGRAQVFAGCDEKVVPALALVTSSLTFLNPGESLMTN